MRAHHGRVYVTKRELISFKCKIVKYLMQTNNIAYSPDMKKVPLYGAEEINSISSKIAIDLLVKTLTNPITSNPHLLKTAANGTNIPSYMKPAIYLLEDEVKQQQYAYEDRSPIKRKLEQLIEPTGLYEVVDGELYKEYKKHTWLHTPAEFQSYQSPTKENNKSNNSNENMNNITDVNNINGGEESHNIATESPNKIGSFREAIDNSDQNANIMQHNQPDHPGKDSMVTIMEQAAQDTTNVNSVDNTNKLPSEIQAQATTVNNTHNLGEELRNIMEGQNNANDDMTLAVDNIGANLLMTQDYAAVYQEIDDMYATDEHQLSGTSTPNRSDLSDDNDSNGPQYSPEGSRHTHERDDECDSDSNEGTNNRNRIIELEDKETQTEEYEEDSIADTLSVSTVEDLHEDWANITGKYPVSDIILRVNHPGKYVHTKIHPMSLHKQVFNIKPYYKLPNVRQQTAGTKPQHELIHVPQNHANPNHVREHLQTTMHLMIIYGNIGTMTK